MKPRYVGVVMVGLSTMRRQSLWDLVDVDAWIIRECKRPPYRRTMYVLDQAGHELVCAELGMPDSV